MDRDFKGVWICKEIWLDNKLTWMEKLFITEINSLDNENGCYASNSYFAEFFNLSTVRCSQIINSLISKGYLSASYIRNGKEIKQRVLKILNTGIKNSKGGIKNILKGYKENFKESNTINNTYNNIQGPGIPPPVTNKKKKEKKLTDQQIIDKTELVKLFEERYLYYYKTPILWSTKEIMSIINLITKRPLEEIKKKFKLLEYKVDLQPNWYTLIPSCLSVNYNKLSEARDQYDD